MSNFWQRILTGSIFIAIVIASIWFGPNSFYILFLAVALIALNEFYNLTSTDHISPLKVIGLSIGAITFLGISPLTSLISQEKSTAIIAVSITLIFIAELYRKKQEPFTNIAYTLLGIVYTVIPFAILTKIATITGTYNRGLIIGYFFLLWSSDSFAYVFGSWLGKNKLFERISPKKSWEGFIGAMLSAGTVAYFIHTLNPEISQLNWIVIALIIVATGTLGDLVESLLKRSLNVKDSGTILPGHGGMLDRFDGLLISVPFVWLYLQCFC